MSAIIDAVWSLGQKVFEKLMSRADANRKDQAEILAPQAAELLRNIEVNVRINSPSLTDGATPSPSVGGGDPPK